MSGDPNDLTVVLKGMILVAPQLVLYRPLWKHRDLPTISEASLLFRG